MTNGLGPRLWAISLPVMFAELSETIIHVTDTALLGRVGDTELAALVLADTILGLWLVAALGLTDAIQIIVARREGEGDRGAAGRTFVQGAALTVALSLALALLLKAISPWLSDLIATSPNVSEAVNGFLQIAAYGIPFLCLSFAFGAFFIGIARTYVLAIATAILTVVNLSLGYVLILGHLGSPKLGLEGAAYASVGAEVVTGLFLIGFSIRSGHFRRYGFRLEGWDRRLTLSLSALAGPVIVFGIIEGFQWLFFFMILEQLGTTILALSNVIYACLLLFLIPAEALSETAVTLISGAIGKGNAHKAHEVLGKIARAAAVATLPLGAVAVAAPGFLFSVLFGIEDAGGGAELALRIVAGGLVFGVPWLVWMGGIQGTGDTPAASTIDSGVSILILVWAAVAGLGFGSGLVAVWSGVAVAWLAGLVAAVAWMRSERWGRVQV